MANNFLPATGTVRRWQVPANASFFDNSSTVRIDSGVSESDAVSSLAPLCVVSSILTLSLSMGQPRKGQVFWVATIMHKIGLILTCVIEQIGQNLGCNYSWFGVATRQTEYTQLEAELCQSD